MLRELVKLEAQQRLCGFLLVLTCFFLVLFLWSKVVPRVSIGSAIAGLSAKLSTDLYIFSMLNATCMKESANKTQSE